MDYKLWIIIIILSSLLFYFKYTYVYKDIIGNLDVLNIDSKEINKLFDYNLPTNKFNKIIHDIQAKPEKSSKMSNCIIGKYVILTLLFIWIMIYFYCIFNFNCLTSNWLDKIILFIFLILYISCTIMNIISLFNISKSTRKNLRKCHRSFHYRLIFAFFCLLIIFTKNKTILLFGIISIFLIIWSWLILKDACAVNIYEDRIISMNKKEFIRKLRNRIKLKRFYVNRACGEFTAIVAIFMICLIKLQFL